MRCYREIHVASLVLAAAVCAACSYPHPAIITVCVFTDPAFRQRPDWREVLNARLLAVSRIYVRQTGLQWKVTGAGLADPTVALGGLDARRAALARITTYPAALMLGITGLTEGTRTASVSPFSHGAMVVDNPQQTELQNTRVLAHELAHLFGAVHEADRNTIMADQPGGGSLSDATFSTRTATLIHALRGYDFGQGVKALTGSSDDRAVRALSEALGGLSGSPRRQAHQILAAALQTDGEFGLALPHLEAALQEDSKDIEARFALAVALERNGQMDLALQTLREGVRLNPQSARLHSALGAVLLPGTREEAIDEFMTSLRLNPGNAPLYATIGDVLAAGMGRTDAAITAYEDALKLAPDMATAQRGLARAVTARAQAQKDVAALRQQLARNRDTPRVNYDLGVAETAAGNFEAATQAFTKAAQFRPGFGPAHASLALIWYLRGDYKTAWAEVHAARTAGTFPDTPFLEALARKMPPPDSVAPTR